MYIPPEVMRACQARGLNRAETEALCTAESRENKHGRSDGVLALLRKTRTMTDVAREINGPQHGRSAAT